MAASKLTDNEFKQHLQHFTQKNVPRQGLDFTQGSSVIFKTDSSSLLYQHTTEYRPAAEPKATKISS